MPEDPSELLRKRLNEINGTEPDGTDSRFAWQVRSYIGGVVLESSELPEVRQLGENVRRAAEKSFSDYVGEKVAEAVQSYLTKTR